VPPRDPGCFQPKVKVNGQGLKLIVQVEIP